MTLLHEGLPIAEASAATGVSAHTLRYYERVRSVRNGTASSTLSHARLHSTGPRDCCIRRFPQFDHLSTVSALSRERSVRRDRRSRPGRVANSVNFRRRALSWRRCG
ncbi:MerR family DNA-binding transcriptional regulator [Microbacterium lacticum]